MSSKADTQVSPGRNAFYFLALVIGVGCTVLGLWQLDRLRDRRERNRLAISQRDLAPVDLDRGSLDGEIGYRQVTLSGRYDYQQEFAIRGRVYRGTPGIQVVTPLRLAGRDTAILVTRGFVPSPDAGRLPSTERYREPEEAAVRGIAIGMPDAGDGTPITTPLGETWHRLDLTAMRARLPYPIARFYVIAEVDPESPRDHTIKGRQLPIRIDPPPLDDGPHLSYAVQWFLIGGSVIGFALVFVRRRNPTELVPD